MSGSITLISGVCEFVGEGQSEDGALGVQVPGCPEFPRVCEERESGSISLVERHHRLARIGELLIPSGLEHGADHVDEWSSGCHGAQQLLELALDDLFAHGLPIGGTALRVAQIVGVAFVAALRPARGHGLIAVVAGDEATQRKVDVEIGANGRFGAALATFLDILPSGEIDKRFVLSRHHVEAPVRVGEIASIKRAGEEFSDAAWMDGAVTVLRKVGRILEEALDLDGCFKTSGSVSFQRGLDDRGERFVAHHELAVAAHLIVAVPNGRGKHPIAIHEASAHAVLGLLAVFLALMLRDAGKEVFDEDGVRVFAEFDGRALQLAPGTCERGP